MLLYLCMNSLIDPLIRPATVAPIIFTYQICLFNAVNSQSALSANKTNRFMTQAWLYLQTASKRPKGASLSIYFVCVNTFLKVGILFQLQLVKLNSMPDPNWISHLKFNFIVEKFRTKNNTSFSL